MKIQDKKEIVLTVEDIQNILFDHLTRQYKLNGDFDFNFIVARNSCLVKNS